MFIDIYPVDLRQISFRNALSKLSHIDLRYAANIKHQETLECFVKSRAVTSAILSQYIGSNSHDLKLSYNEFGKPYLTNHKNHHFNLTHSGHQMLMATAPCPVGIDVEIIIENRDIHEAAKMVFSKQENQSLSQTTVKNQSRKFYNIWTRKEAYLKALGCGFACDPIKISTHKQSGVIEDLTKEISSNQNRLMPWYVKNLNLDNKYASAIALQTKHANIQIRQLSSI